MARKITAKERKEIVRLRDIEKLSWAAISKKLGLSENTCKKYYELELASEAASTPKVNVANVADFTKNLNEGGEALKADINSCVDVIKELATGDLKPVVQKALRDKEIWVGEYEDYNIAELIELEEWLDENDLNVEDLAALNVTRRRFEKCGWTAEQFVDWATRAHNVDAWLPNKVEYLEPLVNFAEKNNWTPDALKNAILTFVAQSNRTSLLKTEIQQLEQVKMLELVKLKKLREEIEMAKLVKGVILSR